jgi:two-component system, OmpR family, phosphate regulon sensor histidine kinase PhoR
MIRKGAFRFIFELMRKRILVFVVLVNSLALLGIVFTQVYWVREAYYLIDEQFTNSVRIAMKGVANQMLNYELRDRKNTAQPVADSLEAILPDPHEINSNLLGFKINEEFKCMQVGSDYEFGIIDLREQSIISGKYGLYTGELFTSPHQIPLVGFKDAEHHVLSAYFPGQQTMIFKKLVNWIIVSVMFAIILIVGFPVSLYIFNRQKKLTDMKTDFINNMTHEFKTPIATISLASEMLMKKNILEDAEKTKRYAHIIFDENTRLQNHVEQILSVSLLEKGQFRLKKRLVDIHELIREIVNKFSLTINERGGEIKTHYCSGNYVIEADKTHLTNVITNLLDNANKYSPEKPWIRIGTQSSEEGLIISVEDHGSGISLENQSQIFKNLYRVPTGNIYSVKGFGIGLYYVKTIVEAHGGHIILKSELNKGSRFDIYLPFVSISSKDNDHNQA